MQIAIDGPAGAGKSTVAKIVADRLGIPYLDTGSMYRAIAYQVLKSGISAENEEETVKIASAANISLDHLNNRIYCDGQDVTNEIRSAEVTSAVSIISAYPGVRKRLVELQREEAAKGNVVMDGRDIGTVVLPQAPVKIFLTASLAERAKRRWHELQKAGKAAIYETIYCDIEKRDANDRSREYSPLKVAEDAFVLDTTAMTVQEAADCIVDIIRRQGN
ncbi:cytidylate kinase [Syntrophobotulus glycolicus DSM 8271]|uniref:Cytidylate kinase n=1 Tax=Syntrophobotulus glycolicus (strain DSM 8271 / FlGlyR) TaxID=645991 RepID=F0SYV0_SYNGF|nr:(d)CMP kinase [Syntrophobotulus glycolicus]ADY55987.1 cytidylate kinase [Syntrophobotulus glycolicus DSM 8271]